MSENRTILTTIPEAPYGFVEVLPESQVPGQYVVGQSSFTGNPDIKKPFLLIRNVGGSAEEFMLGLLSIFMIMVVTELLLTFLSRKRSDIDDEENEYAYAAVRVDEYLRLNMERALRREGWPRRVGQRRKVHLTVTVFAVGAVILLIDTGTIFLTQPSISVSKPGDYNLKGTHPIAASPGLGKFLRRTAIERPCVTPIFSNSNPLRNFSMSACTTLGLEQAHTRVTDTVNTIKFGSWFHEGGGDHIITFGNASITMKTRLFLYGVENGTRRILFSMLYEDYLPAIRYLHELVMYGIMEESCNANYATRTCDEVLKEHRSESTPVNRTLVLWTTRKGKRRESVLGLETNLFLEIRKPWVTVFKRVGPLLTTEQVTEVEGPGSYSHINTEERQENIRGLLVQESRNLGVIGMLLADSVLVAFLVCARRYCRPVSLSQKAWDLFEKIHTKDTAAQSILTDIEPLRNVSVHQKLQTSRSSPVPILDNFRGLRSRSSTKK
ncbi:hypothetical protein BWQ96_03152 [Gracilariopsis chorda]|uniref:Uncharacterized protein n=1 Tax=Gracilariopsis chorda TaxID=448386 RepID=A0A2V3IYD1_9FLOR|nr:hypothetical protein BWQ96_03152 [Gracilariopsis chorda]|eukprot:PXF47075.1 hypothetical protein BWQ96_03152 [Gracilariopsis chorda]